MQNLLPFLTGVQVTWPLSPQGWGYKETAAKVSNSASRPHLFHLLGKSHSNSRGSVSDMSWRYLDWKTTPTAFKDIIYLATSIRPGLKVLTCSWTDSSDLSGSFKNETGDTRNPRAQHNTGSRSCARRPGSSAGTSNHIRGDVRANASRAGEQILRCVPVKHTHQSSIYHLRSLRKYEQVLWAASDFLAMWIQSRILYLLI